MPTNPHFDYVGIGDGNTAPPREPITMCPSIYTTSEGHWCPACYNKGMYSWVNEIRCYHCDTLSRGKDPAVKAIDRNVKAGIRIRR